MSDSGLRCANFNNSFNTFAVDIFYFGSVIFIRCVQVRPSCINCLMNAVMIEIMPWISPQHWFAHRKLDVLNSTALNRTEIALKLLWKEKKKEKGPGSGGGRGKGGGVWSDWFAERLKPTDGVSTTFEASLLKLNLIHSSKDCVRSNQRNKLYLVRSI